MSNRPTFFGVVHMGLAFGAFNITTQKGHLVYCPQMDNPSPPRKRLSVSESTLKTMVKYIRVVATLGAEGEYKQIERIITPEENDWFSVQTFTTELDLMLNKFGDITIPGTSQG